MCFGVFVSLTVVVVVVVSDVSETGAVLGARGEQEDPWEKAVKQTKGSQ